MRRAQLWLALLTLLYVDFLDCTGTLFSMANYINTFIPGVQCAARRSAHTARCEASPICSSHLQSLCEGCQRAARPAWPAAT